MNFDFLPEDVEYALDLVEMNIANTGYESWETEMMEVVKEQGDIADEVLNDFFMFVAQNCVDTPNIDLNLVERNLQHLRVSFFERYDEWQEWN